MIKRTKPISRRGKTKASSRPFKRTKTSISRPTSRPAQMPQTQALPHGFESDEAMIAEVEKLRKAAILGNPSASADLRRLAPFLPSAMARLKGD